MKTVPETVFDKLVVNSLPGVFYIIDRAGQFIHWNKNLEKVTGYSADDISRMSPLDCFTGGDKELIARKISEVFEVGHARVEAGLVKKNGKTIPFVFSGKLAISGDQEYLIGEGLDITELRDALDSSAVARAWLQTVFNNNPDSIAEVDGTGKIVNINPAGLSLYKAKTMGQIIGKSIISFAAPGYKKIIQDYCRKLRTTDPGIIEYEIISISGVRRWIELRALPLIKNEPGPLTKLLISKDITEIKAQADSVYLFDNIMNTSLTGIVIYGSNGQCLSTSDAASFLLGAKKEQLLAQNFNKIKSWRKSGLLRAAKETLATGKPILINVHFVTTFGKEVWLLCNLTRFYSAGKANLLAMFNDLTAVKQAEKAIIQSEAKYRQIMETANDAIFVADGATGILIDANKKAVELIGKPLEKIIGMHQAKLHPADEREIIARVFHEQVAKGSGIVRDFHAINSSGKRIPVEISASIMEQEGKIVIQGIFRDVTERRQAEKAIIEKDSQIRKAYVDVLSAVTGGRLIIMDGGELSGALGRPISESHAISSYKTLATARKKISDTFGEYKTASNGYKEFVFAANEALANAVKHGTNGRYQVLKKDGILQVLITDDGPGIDFSILPKATLIAGFSTKQSLGMGFSIMLDVCDKVLLSTEPGRTSVVLEKAIN